MRQTLIIIGLLFISFAMIACDKEDIIHEAQSEHMADTESMTKEDDTESVKAWLGIWNKAMVEQDVETLGSIMSDEIVLVHITGATQTKQEWLNEVKAGSMRYYDIKMENLKINIDGDLATTTFISVIDANIWGSRGTWRLDVTMQLQRQKESWIRVK